MLREMSGNHYSDGNQLRASSHPSFPGFELGPCRSVNRLTQRTPRGLGFGGFNLVGPFRQEVMSSDR